MSRGVEASAISGQEGLDSRHSTPSNPWWGALGGIFVSVLLSYRLDSAAPPNNPRGGTVPTIDMRLKLAFATTTGSMDGNN
eukprot:6193710-Pleurochrysis_carterae.AAC.1